MESSLYGWTGLGYSSSMEKSENTAPEPKVGSYQDVAWDGAWKSRSRQFWAVAALGVVAGAGLGVVAPFFPVLVGAQAIGAAVVLIPKSIALFSALGMSAGFVGGGLCGATSGAAASVAKEAERRALLRGGEEQGQKISSLTPKENYFNPRVGLAFAAIGALGGLIMAAAYIMMPGAALAMPGMEMLLGAAASSTLAQTAYFTGIMASFGAIFGANFPKLSAEMGRVMGDLLSGKTLGKTWEKEEQPTQSQPIQPVLDEPAQTPAKSFADAQKRFTLDDFIQSRESNREAETALTR